MNNYIFEYYQSIEDGSIVVGEWIRKLYSYIVNGIENKELFFNQKKADKVIRFIENFCHHNKGALAPGLIKLELWQKAMLSVMYGIEDETGHRQFREVFIVVARKNGKTLLASGTATYTTYLDPDYGKDVYFVAPKLDQAKLCFNAFYKNIKTEKELDDLTKKRRSDIYVESTESTAMPIAFNAKKADGYNPSLVVCDEVASWRGDAGLKQYEVFKSALGARTEPMIVAITTAGYENEGIYDELMRRSTSFLNGNSKERRLLPFIYMIDDPTKWNDINELRKSNPNLGVSVKVDYLLEEIAVAEQSLSKKAEFLTKYCNIKQKSSQAWLNAVTIEKAFGGPLDLNEFTNCYCVGGIDLSRTTDLTAATIVIEKNGEYYVFTKFFFPSEKIDSASERDGMPYRRYVERGLLVESGENFVDYNDCLRWFVSLVEQYHIYPLQVGYDRYTAQYLVQDMKGYGFHMDDVYQGENLTPVITEVEGLMKDGKIHCGDNDLLKAHLLSSAVKKNADTGRMKLVKIVQEEHIDGSAALLDAFCVHQKWYEELGGQLKNGG